MVTVMGPNPLRLVARELRYHRRRIAEYTSNILRSRRAQRCDSKCRGWFIDGETLNPTICDDCARLNRYGKIIGDDEIALLPAARRAWRRSVKANKVTY